MMRLTIIFFIISVFPSLYSCTNTRNEHIVEPQSFSAVEKAILKSFDTVPTINISLKDLSMNVDSITHKNFGNKYYCEDIKFNVWFKYNKTDSLKISVVYFYDFDDCPVTITTKNGIYLLVNSYGAVYYNGKITNIDSISSIAYKYYKSIENIDYFVENKKEQSISIMHDLDLKTCKFNKFINQIIIGYFEFLNEKSIQIYNKELSNLNFHQSISLSSNYPLNLRIPNVEEIEIDDE